MACYLHPSQKLVDASAYDGIEIEVACETEDSSQTSETFNLQYVEFDAAQVKGHIACSTHSSHIRTVLNLQIVFVLSHHIGLPSKPLRADNGVL